MHPPETSIKRTTKCPWCLQLCVYASGSIIQALISPSCLISLPGAFCGGSGAFAELPASSVPAGDYQHSWAGSTECPDSNTSRWAV